MKCEYCKKETKDKKGKIYCSRKCSSKAGMQRYNKKLKEQGLLKRDVALRFEILKRDNFQCQYCGRNPKEDNCKLHIDHIYPKSKGGRDIKDNLITACEKCNLGKSDVLLEEKA